MSAVAPKRELEVVPVNCRFYGMNGMFGRLVPTGGNQCGLLKTVHSPCQMERNGYPVDETRCPLVRVETARQRLEDDAERTAFDAGVVMGKNDLNDCPYDDSALTAVWLMGHDVGRLNREAEEAKHDS